MASVYDDIRAALEVRLSNITSIPAIAYENVSFSPTTGTSFVQPKLIPTSRVPAVRGLNPQQRYEGVFRVFCYTPEGNGPSVADDLADKIIEAFDATTDISFTNASSETIIVSVDYASRDEGRIDNPWYYVPVNIGFYLYK
jgi:hypothetical protein